MNNERNGYILRHRNLLPIVIVLGVLVRVAAIFFVGDTELQNEYKPIVMNMLAGRGFAYYSVDAQNVLVTEYIEDPILVIPSAFKSPVYPYFLAFWTYIFGFETGGIRLIEFIQTLLSAVMCWLIYEICREKFGTPQALLASAGFSIYPLLVYSSSQISDTTIFLTIEILAVYLIVKLDKGFSIGGLAIFALTFGLFMLARPEGFIYSVFCLGWLIYRFKRDRLRIILVFTIICSLVLLPWAIRNQVQLGKFTLNTAGGLNLWEGQNKDAVGVPSWYVYDPEIHVPTNMEREIHGPVYDHSFEPRQDQVYLKYAIGDMKDHPGHSVALAFRKAAYFWTSIYFGINFSYPGIDSPVFLAPWLLMLPFFLYGLALSFKTYKNYMMFYLIFIVSTFIAMVFFVLPRYTMLVYPWVIVLAAHGAWTIYTQYYTRQLEHG